MAPVSNMQHGNGSTGAAERENGSAGHGAKGAQSGALAHDVAAEKLTIAAGSPFVGHAEDVLSPGGMNAPFASCAKTSDVHGSIFVDDHSLKRNGSNWGRGLSGKRSISEVAGRPFLSDPRLPQPPSGQPTLDARKREEFEKRITQLQASQSSLEAKTHADRAFPPLQCPSKVSAARGSVHVEECTWNCARSRDVRHIMTRACAKRCGQWLPRQHQSVVRPGCTPHTCAILATACLTSRVATEPLPSSAAQLDLHQVPTTRQILLLLSLGP